jgi:hypothetical protein
MRRACLGLFLCSSFLWAGSAQKSTELIITNVNVVDTRYGGIQPNVTVIVKDGVIAAVTKVAILNTGPNVQILNAGGRYLIPGLWDMNAHLRNSVVETWDRDALLSLYISNGVTGILDLDSTEKTSANQLDPEIILAGPAQRFAASPLFERHSVAGLNEILVACSYVSKDADALPIEHPDTLAQAWVAEESDAPYDRKKAWDLFLKMSDHATWMVPSLISLQTVPEVSTSSEVSATAPASAPDGPDARSSEIPASADAMLAFNLVSGMRRAGVHFLAGTNGPGADLMPGSSLHQELELLVASGFSPLQALQTATFNPALSMAKLDKYGVVEASHIANLVLLEANPLTEIRNTRKIVGVIVRGIYLSRTDLNAMLTKAEHDLNPQPDTARAGELKTTP